jgi:hypothetical protein
MSTHPKTLLLGCALAFAAGAVALTAPDEARAENFATPPPSYNRTLIVRDGYDSDLDDAIIAEPRASIVRLLVGPSGKLSPDGAAPGMLAAFEIGRGPTGFRLTGAWLDVGSETGLSQYTGELTIDFGGRSRFRPVIGAGGGVARTSSSVRDDGTRDPETGAWLGVGVVRAGLGVRLPFEEADARVMLDVTGTLPAIRGSGAPDLSPWVLASLMVGIGF